MNKLLTMICFGLLMAQNASAKVFVLVGPSGAGKSTLINKLLSTEHNLNELISHTTRPIRPGENNNKDYFFVSQKEYIKREANNEFILSTKVHGNLYGVSKTQISNTLKNNRNLICSLNTEAAEKLKALFGEKVVTIFISPPSFEELKNRLLKRKENKKSMKLRLENAMQELKEQDLFDYKIINNNLEASFAHLKSIFTSETSATLKIKQPVEPVTDPRTLRVMSYNIRMAPCFEDEGTENEWRYRLPKINMIFNQYRPDIIGVQEVSLKQMKSFEGSYYNLPYKFLGKYPTKKPIESGLGFIYNTKKIKLISKLHTMWLNEDKTKDEAPAWDGSSYERFVIYAKFKDIATGKDFWFLTTHFDHLGIKARSESAKIVIELAEKLDAPAIITGDFNCFPQAGGKALYKLLSSYSSQVQDSGKLTKKIFGVPGSWIGWDYDIYKQKEGYAKYDYILVKSISKIHQHGIIDDRVWDNNLQKELYPSDHRPVLSDLDI